MITNFDNFLLLELSKNTPIPEIVGMKPEDRTAFFIVGTPGSGKSTYVNDFVVPFMKNCKVFNVDEISNFLAKNYDLLEEEDVNDEEWEEFIINLKNYGVDYEKLRRIYPIEVLKKGKFNEFATKTYDILNKYIHNFIKSGNNFVYECTGKNIDFINSIANSARENNYKIVVILIKSPSFEESMIRNLQRSRTVPIRYQLETYKKVSAERLYKELSPDRYYIVLNMNNKFIYYKMDKELIKIKSKLL
jgi:predicted kinase